MFKTGDLLEIYSGLSKAQRKDILRRQFPLLSDNMNGVRCIVLQRIDSSHVLVAPCDIKKNKKRPPKHLDLLVKCMNYSIHVSTQIVYSVEDSWFEISKLSPIINPQNLLDDIQKGKEQFRKKKLLKNQIEDEKRKRMLGYQRKYELAVMNNDHAAMQAIVDELGFAPIGRGSSKARSAPYTCTNPKPYQGGRFSPK